MSIISSQTLKPNILSPQTNQSLSVCLGPLEVCLATSENHIIEAQKLRYRVFYEELGSTPLSAEISQQKRDFDALDAFCEHLVAIDHSADGRIVGSYRLIRRQAAAQNGGFFSKNEFDISVLEAYPGDLLELGRACIDKEYRQQNLIQLLWKAVSLYAYQQDIRLMFGCASFPTTDVTSIRQGLTYLYHHHLMPAPYCPRALEEGYISLNQIPAEDIDVAQAYKQLPPLIKGYVRLGCKVGDGAFFDQAFGSIDVCIVLEVKNLRQAYFINRNDMTSKGE